MIKFIFSLLNYDLKEYNNFLDLAKNHNYGNEKLLKLDFSTISNLMKIKSIFEDPNKLANFKERYDMSVDEISKAVNIHRDHQIFLEFYNINKIEIDSRYPKLSEIKKSIEQYPTDKKIKNFNDYLDYANTNDEI